MKCKYCGREFTGRDVKGCCSQSCYHKNRPLSFKGTGRCSHEKHKLKHRLPEGAYKLFAWLSRSGIPKGRGKTHIDLKALREAYQRDIEPMQLVIVEGRET